MEQSNAFISYRRSDVEFVKAFVQAIKSTGREVWVDWEDIPPGVEGFSDEIQRGIEGGNAFIPILSPAYLESEYCLMELREAIRLKKRIIPVVIKKFEPAPPPEGIGHINWVYFTPHAGQENTFEQAFPNVIKALEADYAHTREHTRLLTRALEWDKRQRNNSYLLNGAEIDQAENWQVKATAKDPPPTELQLDYILNSRKQQRLQQRRITASIGVLLALAVIAAVFAVFKANEARISAEISHSNALASAALQPGNEDIAVALALEATRTKYAPESTYKALARVVYPPGGIRNLIKLDEDFKYLLSPTVSPDGRYIAINNHLYDMTTGKIVMKFENAPDLTMNGIFLPEGKRVILAGDRSYDNNSANPIYLGMYEAATGKLFQSFDTGIGVLEVQLSTDGNTLIAYQPDQKVTWWNVNTGEKIREFETGDSKVAFSPDLKLMANVHSVSDQTADGTATVQTKFTIVNMQTATTLTVPEFASSNISMIRFSNDSQEVAVYSVDYATSRAKNKANLTTIDTKSAEVIARFSDITDNLVSIRYSPDDTSLVASSFEQTVTIWNTKTGAIVQKQTAHRSPTIFADFTQGGRTVVSMDNNGVIMHWDILPGNLDKQRKSTNEWTKAITPDGRYLITEQYNTSSYAVENIIIRDGQTMKETSRLPMSILTSDSNGTSEAGINILAYFITNGLENGFFCYQATMYEPGSINSSGKGDPNKAISSTLNVASLSSGKIIRSWPLDTERYVGGAQISPKGNELLINFVGQGLNHLEAWDIASGAVTHTYVAPFSGYLSFAFDPTGTRLLLATDTRDENWESLATSTQIVNSSNMAILFDLGKKIPATMFFTPDGSQFVFAQESQVGPLKTDVMVYDSKTGNVLHSYTIDAPNNSRFNMFPNGKSFTTDFHGGGGGGGGEMTPSGIGLRGFGITINATSFLQWDLATGELIWEFPGMTSNPVFSPNGKFMFTSGDNDLIVWRFDPHAELIAWACANRYVPKLTPEQRERFGIANTVSVCESAGK